MRRKKRNKIDGEKEKKQRRIKIQTESIVTGESGKFFLCFVIGVIFMYYTVEIGENIKILRKVKGITQEKLAEDADICVTWLREIEHGCANVTRDVLERLAKAMDVPVWIFFVLKLEPDAVWNELEEVQALLASEGEEALV